MKKLIYLLQIILILAVAFLYFQFYRLKKSSSQDYMAQFENKAKQIQNAEKNSLSIAYINSDTTLLGYNFYTELKTRLENQQNNAEKQIEEKERELQSYYQSIKTMVDKGLIKEEDAQMKLMTRQQDLDKLKSKLSDELVKSQKDMNEQLYDTVANFLLRYNKKAGFTYILNYTKGGPIIIAPPMFDITKETLKGLNEEYRKKLEKR